MNTQEDNGLKTEEHEPVREQDALSAPEPDSAEPKTDAEDTGEVKVNPLREAPVLKLILKFSVPAMIGMLFNAIYNIVDRAFIGNAGYLGADALAALQFCFPPMMITFGLALIFGIGGSVTFSIALGKRDHETAKAAMGNALALSLILFAVLQIFCMIFAKSIILWFIPSGTSAHVIELAASYFRIISFGLIFQSINVFGNNFIRADGSPVTSMVAIMLGAAVNVLLDYIFIFPLGMGIEGAALATVIGQAVSTVWILYYFLGRKGNRFFKIARFRLEIKKIRIRADLSFKIMAAGFSAFVLQAAGSILTIVLNYTMTKYALAEGRDAAVVVSAMGIINSVQTVILTPLVGLNHGLNPIIGYNYGAKLAKRVKQTLLMGIVAASFFALLGWGATRLFPTAIIRIFSPQQDLVAYTTGTMTKWLSTTLLLGVAIVGGNYFQASGKSLRALILSALRQVLIIVPLILILPVFYGLDGIFYAQPVSDIVVTVVTLILLAVEFLRNPLYKKNAALSAGN